LEIWVSFFHFIDDFLHGRSLGIFQKEKMAVNGKMIKFFVENMIPNCPLEQ